MINKFFTRKFVPAAQIRRLRKGMVIYMEYGNLHMRINEILQEKGISKNKICKDLDIPRTNFNKYCRDGVSRLDTGFICKLCWYLNIEVGELIEYKRPEV